MRTRKIMALKGNLRKTPNRIKEDLSLSEAYYHRIFETSQDGILIVDVVTEQITDVNPFLMNLLGYEREDFVDKALWDFCPISCIQAAKSAFTELLKTGFIRIVHFPLQTKDGRFISVEFIGSVYQTGQKRRIQYNIRDNAFHEQVEEDCSELGLQLKQAKKMAAVSTLAGGIAHQFDNALFIITGAVALIQDNGLSDDTHRSLHLIKRATEQMNKITRKLLAYAKCGKYNIETISLCDLVNESLPLIKAALKPSVVIEADLPTHLPAVQIDRDQIKMVLTAILANASEAIDSHGLIRLSCSKQVMTTESVENCMGLVPGTYIGLTIKDNGRGMDEETQKRLFEPFFTTHLHGRGLGMAAVYGIVKNHNGWISIQSRVGQGTTVYLCLPAVESLEKITAFSPVPIQELRKNASF